MPLLWPSVQAILVCFRLHKAKDVVVNNAAAASLRQICIELFDKVLEEAKDPGTSVAVARGREPRCARRPMRVAV